MNSVMRRIRFALRRFVLILLLVLLPSSSISDLTLKGLNASGAGVENRSTFPDYPPVVDGVLSPGEWDGAAHVQVENGKLYFQNDAAYLYLVFEESIEKPLPGKDTSENDPAAVSLDIKPAGASDQSFYLTFKHLSTESNACVQHIGLTGISGTHTECLFSTSQAATGFGWMQGAAYTKNWEFAISLPEIGVEPGDLLSLGLNFESAQTENETPPGSNTLPGQMVAIRLVRPAVALLVLAHQDFLAALGPLKNFKDKTGMPTYVQSWQSLAASFHSEGGDDAERIKRAIRAYYLNDQVRYVMLVGDGAHFPVRYSLTEHDNEDIPAGWTFIPTDYYYADLFLDSSEQFNSWDANQNGYFGELNGENTGAAINVDEVGSTPSVAVGRVPAATPEEVSIYVNKIIAYERNAYQASWAKRTMVVTTTDWVPPACEIANAIAGRDLSPQGYQVTRLFEHYIACGGAEAPTSVNILKQFNQGVGFVSYFGHGSHTGWSIPGDAFDSTDLAGLTNAQNLPIVFTAGCNTASFGAILPQQSYLDNRGMIQVSWIPKKQIAQRPVQPADLQAAEPVPSFGAQLLVNASTGAVAYLGAATSSQYPAYDLARFFSSLDRHTETLGDMWSAMIRQYYLAYSPADAQAAPAWYRVALFQQPWKFSLLGDPSLRIKGVPFASDKEK